MGTGFLDVSVEILPSVLTLLPITYKIISSLGSQREGVIRLKLRSEFIVGAGNQLTCQVIDTGSTRTVMVLPA